MRSLYFISASLMEYPETEVRQGLDIFIQKSVKADSAKPLVLCPDGMVLPAVDCEVIRYGTTIHMEADRDIWRLWSKIQFDRIVVLGTNALADFEEIAIVCFFDAPRKSYLNASGGGHDVHRWQKDIRPDFQPRPVGIEYCAAAEQDEYVQRVHQWLAAELMVADFGRPAALAIPEPEISLYRSHRLARDLAQLTTGLQIEAHGAAFSLLKMPDGSIVRSADYYRAIANFVASIDGIDDILDVGCGSGFVCCHLAAMNKYARVLGIDSSQTRIDSARLHAELAGSTATFSTASMTSLGLPNKSVDLTVTSYALEQSGRELGHVLNELRRVTRKFIVLCEPTTEYFPTLPGIWHVQIHGWANTYFAALNGLNYAVRPNLLSQYYNPSSIFVIDLLGSQNPMTTRPHLFRPDPQDWPGGIFSV